MATDSDEKLAQVFDFSGGIQRKSSQFMRVKNQQDLAINASFERIGGVEKSLGYTRVGNTITTTTTSTTTSSSSSSSTSTSSSTSSSTSTSTSTSSTTTA